MEENSIPTMTKIVTALPKQATSATKKRVFQQYLEKEESDEEEMEEDDGEEEQQAPTQKRVKK